MCCEPVRTASGQTCWVVMEVTSWFLRMFDLLPKHQHQDEHRLLHRKSSALWGKKCWMGQDGEEPPPFSAGTRCRLFHVVHVDLRVGEAFHHRPFVSQPCRTLGLSRGSRCWFDFQHGIGSSRLQHICVFSHQCVLVQYDGCLMLKQDRYYDLGRIFFLPMVSIFYTIFLTCAEQIDALCEYSMTNLY